MAFRLACSLIIFLTIGRSNTFGQGETCATAELIAVVPYSYTGTTCGSGNDYTLSTDPTNFPNLCDYPNQSDYIQAEDFVFEFVAPETNCYTFMAQSSQGGSLHVFDLCPDDPDVECLGFRRFFFPGTGTTGDIFITAGESIFVVISGTTGCEPTFTLNVTANDLSDLSNDFCENPLPLTNTGTNTGATDCGEPDEWAPENYPGVDCMGGLWLSNENGVWYNLTIDSNTPQPFSIGIGNVMCTGGGSLLQMGIWEDTGDCQLSEGSFVECAVGIDSVSIGPITLPIGEYYLFIDGLSGSNCVWEFTSELLCEAVDPVPDTYGPFCAGEILPTMLSVTPNDAANIITWYDLNPLTGGTAIDNGVSIPTPAYITNTPGQYEIWVTETVLPDCEGTPQQIIIDVLEIPTATLSGAGSVCAGSGDLIDLILDLSGTGPWDVVYAINGINQPVMNVTSSPQTIQAGEGETITLISVSAGGCEGTVSGSITIGVILPPTANLSGGGAVCSGSGDLIDLILDLGGTGPWDVVLEIDGVDQPVTTYISSPQTIQAGEGQIISITSVAVDGCEGTTSGTITIGSIDPPTADLSGSGMVCEGSGDLIDLVLDLGGTGPWDVVYAINGINQPSMNYTTTPQTIQAAEGETITLISVSAGGGGCNGIVTGSITIGTIVAPTATLSGFGSVCEGSGDLIDLILDLTGSGPWDVILSINGIDQPTNTFATTPQTIQAGEGETIAVISVNEGGCEGTTSGSVSIESIILPTATLSGSGNICENSGDLAELNLDLTGDGPWDVVIAIDGINQPINTYLTSPQIILAEEGQTISISSVSQSGCNGTTAGMVTIETIAAPTATLTGSGEICTGSGNTIDLVLDLTGEGPWEVRYSIDGTEQALESFDSSPQIIEWNEGETFELISVEASGCAGMVSTIIAIDLIDPTFATLDIPNPLCNTTANGSTINLNALIIGGDNSGTWVDNDGSGATGTLPNIDFNGVTPNTYTFTYTTGNAQVPCTNVSYQVSIIVEDCACPSVAVLSTPPICNDNVGINLASLQQTTEEGTWSIVSTPVGSNPATLIGTIFNALNADAGDYELVFTLNTTPPMGCPSTSAIVIITVLQIPNSGTGTSLISCSDAMDFIDLNAQLVGADSGGSWIETSLTPSNGAAFNPVNGTFDPNGQLNNIYVFEYNANGGGPCQIPSAVVSVMISNPITAEVESTGSICNSTADGSILNFNDFIISGDRNGTWTDDNGSGANGNFPMLDFDGVVPGSYLFTYTVESIAPCTNLSYELEIIVEDCACPSVAIRTPEAICNDFGMLDLAELQITNEAGTWSITNFPPGLNPAIINGTIFNASMADAGEYELTFTLNDLPPSGCSSSSIILIQVSEVSNAGFNNSTTICNDEGTSIALNTLLSLGVEGGSWSIDGSPIPSPGVFDPITSIFEVGGLSNGDYNFNYTIANSAPCPGDVASFTVTVESCNCINPSPPIAVIDQIIICEDEAISNFEASSQSGTSIIWYDSLTGGIVLATGNTFTPQVEGTYYAAVVNDPMDGCESDRVPFTLEVIPNPIASISLNVGLVCIGDPVIFSFDGEANDDVIITWMIDGVEIETGRGPFEFRPTQAGIFELSINLNQQGCIHELITNFTASEVEVSTILPTTIPLGSSIVLETEASSSPSSNIRFDWMDSSGEINGTTLQSPTVQPTETTTYSVTATNEQGCVAMASTVITINIGDENNIFFPNVFSPNGDGINDLFGPETNDDLAQIEFSIYNRWGDQVFNSGATQLFWNGKFNDKNSNIGVYVYHASVTFSNGETQLVKGSVTLVR